jgi:site-specific DNA-methyltransferase (adenine-specific)
MTGDCREVMAGMADGSVDAIVTDPPYELGFMGKSWDASGIAYDLEVWRQALRVLKPGGHLLAFSGSRTYHRMVCAIEDAGFEIRDQIMWLYGSGFPKSHDVSKALDREAGAERRVVGSKLGMPGYHLSGHDGGSAFGHGIGSSTAETRAASAAITAPATSEAEQWSGWGTALKPAHEPIVVARKPFKGTVAQNVLAHGTGAMNIDGCRVEASDHSNRSRDNSKCEPDDFFPGKKRINQVIPDGLGRWPANVIHDGSDEVLRLFPETGPARRNVTSDGRSVPFMQAGGEKTGGFSGRRDPSNTHDDAGGSAARFFYCAKASKRDREEGLDGFEAVRTGGMQATADGSMLTGSGNERTTTRANIHPTVKPTDLMRYLCRLVTPPGGLVLDPFTGSGSTGKAAVLEGFQFIGIELSEEYSAIARARIQNAINSKSI